MKISASLTYDQPQTNERRDNQKDIRDDNALLLLMYDPDSQSQSNQDVSASEQRPLHGLLQCQPSRSERTEIPRNDRSQKLTITASPERPILKRIVGQISKSRNRLKNTNSNNRQADYTSSPISVHHKYYCNNCSTHSPLRFLRASSRM